MKIVPGIRKAALLLLLTAPLYPQGFVDFDGASGPLGRLPSAADILPAQAVQTFSRVRSGESGPAGLELQPGKLRIKELPAYVFSSKTNVSPIIVSAIDASRKSVDVALYGLTLQDVAEALYRAKKRGVRVRVIMNEAHVFQRKSEQVQFLIDKRINMRTLHGVGSYGTMHNKFAIIDSKLLETGSFNWTSNADSANYENAAFFRTPELVAGYQAYWDWMWRFAKPVNDGPEREIVSIGHYGKPPEDATLSVKFNGVNFPDYSFSPQGGSEDWIIEAINSSRRSISMAVFSFYSQKIGSALVAAGKRGVDVRIVVDRTQGKTSPLTDFLIKNNMDLRWSVGPGGKGAMHNKFAAFDGKLLVNGSFNWTANAENSNFENVFYTSEASYVAGFSGEFEKIYSQAAVPGEEGTQEDDLPSTGSD